MSRLNRLTLISVIVAVSLGSVALVREYRVRSRTVAAAPNPFVITLTDRGFVPAAISVPQGSTVVFKSRMNREYWPASDSHPSHGIYPEFDPKRPLGVDESWSFKFDRIGVWKYHDHMEPLIHGKIVVMGDGPSALTECLGENHPGDSVKAECWQYLIEAKIKQGGMDAAFDAVKEWYGKDPVFREACHDVMHVVGEAAYHAYSADGSLTARPETSYCGYGFYHGFIETMFADKGGDSLVPVKAYCDATLKYNNINLTHACYHGIGHASFDNISAKLWGNESAMLMEGVSTCEKVFPDDVGRERCVSGVTNALANAMSSRSYRLSYTGPEVADVCKPLAPHYYPVCYPELAVGYANNSRFSRQETLAVFDGAPSTEARSAAIAGYINEVVREMQSRGVNNPELVKMCKDMRDVADQNSCIAGVVMGLLRVGEPGNPDKDARAFCTFAVGLTETMGDCSRYLPNLKQTPK